MAKLWMSGGLPMITETDDDNFRVVGEIWQLEDSDRLADVDALEGHPHWYRRKEVKAWLRDGEIAASILAWAYFMDPAEIIAYGARHVESGDYLGGMR